MEGAGGEGVGGEVRWGRVGCGLVWYMCYGVMRHGVGPRTFDFDCCEFVLFCAAVLLLFRCSLLSYSQGTCT